MMKKHVSKFFRLSVLIFFLGFHLAQSFAQDLGLGVKAGVNIMNFNLDNVTEFNTSNNRNLQEEYNTLIGFNGAVFLDVRFSKFFALQPELYFNQKGGSYKGTGVNSDGVETVVEYDLRAFYVEVPVLAKLSASDDLWRVSALIGLSIAIGAGGNNNFSIQNDFVNTSRKEQIDYDDAINLGFHTGIAAEFDLGRIWYYFEARYLLNVSETSLDAVGDASFNTIAFSTGFLMPIGK